MSKQTKAIECPQCGSTDKTEIRAEIYRCKSCQTEYFLDDDDVTVNFNHNFDKQNSSVPAADRIKGKRILYAVLIVTFVVVLASFLISRDLPKVDVQETNVSHEGKDYYAGLSNPVVVSRPTTGAPVIMVIEDRNYYDSDHKPGDAYYVTFYDPFKGNNVYEWKIAEESASSIDFEIKRFHNSEVFIIYQKNRLYKVDNATLKVSDVTNKFFHGMPETQMGLARIAFLSNDQLDGLSLQTNDGKDYTYLVATGKLYDPEMIYTELRHNWLSIQGKDKLSIFKFSNVDRSKINLNRLDYVMHKDKMTESETNLTPGRLYFDPEVLLGTDSLLLIQFRADANPKSEYKIQQLGPVSGTPVWTSSVPKDSQIKSLETYPGGYIAVTVQHETIILDRKGNIISQFKPDVEFR
jgi:DNA-directed RNA polymerase subunit RPC12/RpoP